MVKLIGSERCDGCKALENLLRSKKVEFTKLSIDDTEVREYLISEKIFTIPVLITDKGRAIGFDPEKVEEIL